MAELRQTGNVQIMSNSGRVKSFKKAASLAAKKRADHPSDASMAPKTGEAGTSLPALYHDLLGSRGELEEELQRRTLALATLAHEIKSPLATVKVSISTLLSGQPGNALQQRELLEIIGEESDRMERWIDSATEVSQSEAGQLRLEKKAS